MATAVPASAAAYRPGSSQLICGTGPASASSSATNYLPINRWAGAVSTQHERQSGGGFLGINVGGSINQLERSIFVGFPTELSSSMWRLGAGAVTLANNFCFSTSVAGKANTLAASIGSAFTGAGAPLLVGAVVIALLAAIWSASRGRAKWSSVIRVCVIVGIFAAMVGAAAASTPTNPSPGSPEWIITHTYTAIAKLANLPTAAITGALVGATGSATTSTPTAKSDPLACSHYESALITDYQNAYAGKLSDSVPMAINGLWMQSVLPAYSEMALGGSNNFAALVSCRLLEDQSAVPASTQLNIERATGETAGFPGSNSAAAAWYTGAGNSTTVDRSLIAWAACQSTSANPLVPAEWTATTGRQIPSAWTQIVNPTQTNGGTKITSGDCNLWWSATVTRTATTTGTVTGHQVVGSTTNGSAPAGAEFLPSHSPFNWSGTQGKVASATGKMSTGTAASGIRNYIFTLHGETNTIGEVTAFVLFLASLSIMVVFLILAVALLIAKLSLLIAILLLPIMLILAAFPRSASSKLPGYLKHTLSLVIFATCAGLLLSVVALVTELVAGLGVAIAGPGSVIAILWIAIAPIAAIVGIHHFFKKVLKAPSPFKPTSALAYGAAAGGLAGAGMASLGDRAMSRGRQAVSSRMPGRGGAGAGGSGRGVGGKSGRSGGMAPDGGKSRGPGGKSKPDTTVDPQQQKADEWSAKQAAKQSRREQGVGGGAAGTAGTAGTAAGAVDGAVAGGVVATGLRGRAQSAKGRIDAARQRFGGTPPPKPERGKVRTAGHYAKLGAGAALAVSAGPIGAVVVAGVALRGANRRYGMGAQRRRQDNLGAAREEQRKASSDRLAKYQRHLASKRTDKRTEKTARKAAMSAMDGYAGSAGAHGRHAPRGRPVGNTPPDDHAPPHQDTDSSFFTTDPPPEAE